MIKRVLVIGANSYIGKKFSEYIVSNNIDEIKVALVSASDGSWNRINFSEYDVILHLSGIVHRKEKKNMKSLYYNVNYKLAVELAKKAKENQVKQFIFMSSAAVFGSVNGCITEKTPLKPDTYYGKSKLAAEKAIWKLQSEDFKIAIVRPPMVYGEGCKGNYPRLEKLAKYTPVFPAYHNKRSMVHIDTLSKYLIKVIMEEKNGYFHPQDAVYGDTCEMVVEMRRKMGKKTVLVGLFNFCIYYLVKGNGIINKMFGDFYYSKNL